MDATSYMNHEQGSGWSLMQDFNDDLDNRAVQKIAIAERHLLPRQYEDNGLAANPPSISTTEATRLAGMVSVSAFRSCVLTSKRPSERPLSRSHW